MSVRLSSTMTSSRISGCDARKRGKHRHHDGRDRMLGSRDANGAGRLAAQSADCIHAGGDVVQRGTQRAQQRLARFVVDTERVVRDSSRTPSRSSRAFRAWLNADCDMPSSAAARVENCPAPRRRRRRRGRTDRPASFMHHIHKLMRIIAPNRNLPARVIWLAACVGLLDGP